MNEIRNAKLQDYSGICMSIIDSLEDSIAVLDNAGNIIFVNQSWEKFAVNNGGRISCSGVGINYLDICRKGAEESETAGQALDGIKQVIKGTSNRFVLEYPCDSDEEKRWFLLTVTPIAGMSGHAVVSHANITERKLMEDRLKESEDKYSSLFHKNHSVILIIDQKTGDIVDANPAACSFYGYGIEDIRKMKISSINMLPREEIFARMSKAESSNCSVFQFPHRLSDGSIRDVEVYSGPIWIDGRKLLYSIVHDITERKKELERAAGIQEHRLSTSFPIESRASLESIYMPAMVVSGDFYQLYRINDHQVVGILGDVRGKGVTAALNVTAMKVLFGDGALVNDDPVEILKYLNRQVIKHLEEEYTAAICFKFDFKSMEAVIAGAGINQFYYSCSSHRMIEKVVKGPFLGMFEDSVFEKHVLNFKSKDRFYFYTDGLDFIFEDPEMKDKCVKTDTIKELKHCIRDILNTGRAIDDCTWLGIEIK